jgi:RNA polymerase sigma-70 factor (ECF subfamily)
LLRGDDANGHLVEIDFEDLYRRQFQSVFRATFPVCGDRGIAEDATQEAFAKAYERWSRLKYEPWVVGWIVTTAMNIARRTRRLRTPPSLRADGWGADVDGRLDVWAAMASLPKRQLQATVLHYFLDMPLNEIGVVMGCSTGTIKAHLSRARERLARDMGSPYK